MRMEEFCKVSIHNHLGGKGADRTISDEYTKKCQFDMAYAERMLNEAKEYNFELIALTQANRLPAKEYKIHKEYGRSLGICLLPGIEINLCNEQNHFLHTVVVFDDKVNVDDIEIRVDNCINKNKKNCMNIDQFLEIVVDYKCIIAAHGIKQNAEGRSATKNPDVFSELINISDSIPVVLEDNHKYHKVTLLNQLKDKLTSKELKWIENSESFSAADRLNFKDISSPTYIWGNPNFDDLYYSCFMNSTRIKRQTDIINKVNYISRIEIMDTENSQILPKTITCSHGLNSIIGASGSGKTLLLDIIKRKLTGEGLDNKTISKECNYEEVYKLSQIHLFDKDGNELDEKSGYKIVEGEILYNKVISAYQSDKNTLLSELGLNIDITTINPLIDKFNKQLNIYIENKRKINKNRKEINTLISNINSANEFLNANNRISDETIEYTKDNNVIIEIEKMNQDIISINTDIENLEDSLTEISKIGKKYEANDSFETDLNLFKKKIVGLVEARLYSLQQQINRLNRKEKIQKIIYDAVLSYNKSMGLQFKAVSEKKQEIDNSYKSILSKLIENIELIKTISIPKIDENEIKHILQFEDKNIARLTLKTVKLCISKDELKEYFPSNIGNSPKLKLSLFRLENLKLDNIDSIREFADVFVDNDYTNEVKFSINNLNFIDYRIELKNLNGRYENIDSISAGNLGKIYINKMFEDKISKEGSNTIILYDQPDTNMEKIFILEELVSKISNLRNNNQIFITTHEPLLVVNADSNNIIVAQNDKTASKPNEIQYFNKSFVGINSKKELMKEVAMLIDGKPEAVKLRSTLYGGVINED